MTSYGIKILIKLQLIWKGTKFYVFSTYDKNYILQKATESYNEKIWLSVSCKCSIYINGNSHFLRQ